MTMVKRRAATMVTTRTTRAAMAMAMVTVTATTRVTTVMVGKDSVDSFYLVK